jgi:tetratricopeptide (TPR) repeat protein
MQNEIPEKKPSISARINDFIQKHRKPIFMVAGTVFLLLIAGVVALSLMDVMRNNAISVVEGFNSRYETLRPSISDGSRSGDVAKFLEDIEVFAKKNSGYAGGRAWSIIATIHSEKKDWTQAEAAWAAAAKAAEKTYLCPIALFNAGAAAEEQGKTDEAIGYYSGSISAITGFPAAARAQYAIGRLQESRNDNAAAIEAYRAVISGWPYDRAWTNLAHSRIIALEVKQAQ